MIDQKKLQEAYDNDGFYSLQLEVGDICNQACLYCYMNALPEETNRLTDSDISGIIDDCDKIGISAIEWLGGEPLFRRSIFEHMAHARDLGLRNNMWTGGLVLADREILNKTVALTAHGIISVHVSTVDPDLYRRLHPGRTEADLYAIIEAVKEILATGYPPEQMLNSVTFTGLQSADDMIATIDYFEENFGIRTSLNVYHTYLRPGHEDNELQKLIPDKKSVARVYKRYGRQYGLDWYPMNCVSSQYCSATVAVLCDGTVTPCATVRDPAAPDIHSDGRFAEIVDHHRNELIFKKFKDIRNRPEECRECRIADCCWGCRSRAWAAGLGLYGKDPRCFRS